MTQPASALAGISLRAYQREAVALARAEMRAKRRRVVIVLPTGAGKTRLAAFIVASCIAMSGRVLWLAHRSELVDQACRTLHGFGLPIGCVSASSKWPRCADAPVQVASIQTLVAREAVRPPATLIVWDECHHAGSEGAETWTALLDAYPDVPMIGLTATPERGDGGPLAPLFNGLVVGATVRELTELWQRDSTQGLVPCEIVRPNRMLDPGQIAQHPLATYQEHGGRRQAILFARSVEEAQTYAEEFSAAGHRAACVTATTPAGDREVTLELFRRGVVRVLCNVYVLCLDEQTEILTDRGWAGIDNLTASDRVANWWPDHRITFEVPHEVFRRGRRADEEMYFVDTRLDVRVTRGHRMVCRTLRGGTWHVKPVETLVGTRFEVPVSGIAAPAMIDVDHGRKAPHELTIDECRFIGFWLGDGSVRRGAKRGGVEFTASQSKTYPYIIEWFDGVVARCGLSVVRREVEYEVSHVRWSFKRGTRHRWMQPSHWSQTVGGVYSIEPYLDKRGSQLMWGLNVEQFDALIDGLWMADGDHGDGRYHCATRQRKIESVSRSFLSLLQAIAVTRGYRAHVLRCGVPRFGHHKQLYRLVIKKTASFAFAKERITPEPESVRAERVWCARVSSGAIMVRRNGKACVVGNCEGTDLPMAEVCILARGAGSAGIYIQMVGRVLRPHPGKRSALLLDGRGVSFLHGMPEDERVYSLEGRGIALAGTRKCTVCQQPLEGYPCESCGYSPDPRDAQATEIVNVPMVKFARMIAQSPAQREETLRRRVRQTLDRGHKVTSVKHWWRAVYGEELAGARLMAAVADVQRER